MKITVNVNEGDVLFAKYLMAILDKGKIELKEMDEAFNIIDINSHVEINEEFMPPKQFAELKAGLIMCTVGQLIVNKEKEKL